MVDQLEKEFLPAIGYALVCNQDREQEPQIAKPECMDDANAEGVCITTVFHHFTQVKDKH